VRGDFCAECCAAVAEVEAAVQECNREGYSALTFKDLHRLLSRVVGHTRSKARLREEAVAYQVGLDHRQVLELRGWWGRLTADGVGTAYNVRKALEELDPGQNISDDEIEQMMLELEPPPEGDPLPNRKIQRRVSLTVPPPRRRMSGSPRLLGVEQESRPSLSSKRLSACLDADALLAAIQDAQDEDDDCKPSDSDDCSSIKSEPESRQASRSWSPGGFRAFSRGQSPGKVSQRGSLQSSRRPSQALSPSSRRPSQALSPSSRRASVIDSVLKLGGSQAPSQALSPSGRRHSAAGLKHPATLRFELQDCQFQTEL
jgi:hypothetical protein